MHKGLCRRSLECDGPLTALAVRTVLGGDLSNFAGFDAELRADLLITESRTTDLLADKKLEFEFLRCEFVLEFLLGRHFFS
jgi:hypothetical protein